MLNLSSVATILYFRLNNSIIHAVSEKKFFKKKKLSRRESKIGLSISHGEFLNDTKIK
jgi:hypothetical protein